MLRLYSVLNQMPPYELLMTTKDIPPNNQYNSEYEKEQSQQKHLWKYRAK
ncbi:hypothetical protein ALT785_250088 [Alteromonas infernus]